MSIGWAVVMIVLGLLAVFLPYQTGIGISVLVGWIMVFSGVAYVAYAFAAPGAGAFLWRMLIGIAYVGGGGYLAFHPGIALESLTLVVAAVFFAEGVLEVITFFQFRSVPGSGWIFFDAVVTLVLAYSDLASLAVQFIVGDRDTRGHQPHRERLHPADVLDVRPQDDQGDRLMRGSTGVFAIELNSAWRVATTGRLSGIRGGARDVEQDGMTSLVRPGSKLQVGGSGS